MKVMLRFGALALMSLVPMTNIAHAQYFRDYPCTEDCSGHEAGYEWAERNDIDDEYDCSGNSNSFNEGCQAYVEEQEQNDRLNNDDQDD